MHTLDIKEINKDTLLVFLISYNFSISFGPLFRIYDISSKLFWMYIVTFAPILKVGVRKISQLSKSASNILDFYNGKDIELTDTEKYISKIFKLFIADSFYNGTECIHFSKLIDYKLSVDPQGTECAYQYLVDNFNDIESIYIEEDRYLKISRASYVMDKYYGDLNFNTLDNMTIREIVDKLDDLNEKQKTFKKI